MVEKTTSAVAEIVRAGENFQSAKRKQCLAIGTLNEVHLRAKSDPDVEKEIRTAFEELDSKHKPKKCKALSSIIGWLAFPYSKQRVSDVHKFLVGAPDSIKSADDFADWVESNGGIRATLRSLSKPRNVSSSGSEAKPLHETCHDAIAGLAGHTNANVRYVNKNPLSAQLVDGQLHIQVTEYVNGKYKVFEALLLDDKIEYPKHQAPVAQKQRPIAPLGDLAKRAQSSAAKPTRNAGSAS